MKLRLTFIQVYVDSEFLQRRRYITCWNVESSKICQKKNNLKMAAIFHLSVGIWAASRHVDPLYLTEPLHQSIGNLIFFNLDHFKNFFRRQDVGGVESGRRRLEKNENMIKCRVCIDLQSCPFHRLSISPIAICLPILVTIGLVFTEKMARLFSSLFKSWHLGDKICAEFCCYVTDLDELRESSLAEGAKKKLRKNFGPPGAKI